MNTNGCLKKDNTGASLIAVVIAMVFVVSIGVIIMNITLSNISMKEMELSSKTNFYSAEDVLETIKSSLTDNSALCLETAYVTILGKYAESIRTDNGVQSSFQAAYLDSLIKKYKKEPANMDSNIFWKTGTDGDYEKSKLKENGQYAMGFYDTDILTESLSGTIKDNAVRALEKMDPDKAQFEADYSAGTFTLKNVHIVYTDTRGYETSISTDLILTTPVLNFDGSNNVKEFMKYCIIADKKIDITGGSEVLNIQVKGNAYAGCDGIESKTGSYASFTGNNVITRGTVTVKNGGTLTIGSIVSGNYTTNLWAENILTSGSKNSTAAATLNLTGNMYISDDLSLDCTNSMATLAGNYYGYNFQKLYTTDYVNDVLNNGYERDSAYSSSIIVNSSNSKLDMTGLNELRLAGRTFISKGSLWNNSDILMGESLAARTDQLEYYVPETYITVTTESTESVSMNNVIDVRFKTEAERAGFEDPSAGDVALSKVLFGGDGIGASGDPEIYDYIEKYPNSFSTYYYVEGNERLPRFYLKFKSLDAANKFVAKRAAIMEDPDSSFSKNVKTFLGKDVDAIKISDSTLKTLSGSYLTVSSTATKVVPSSLNSDLWKYPAVSTDEVSVFAQDANHKAQMYKSLQLDLTTTNLLVNSRTIRFEDNGLVKNDKSTEPLFYNLIDNQLLDNFLSKYTDRTYDNGADGMYPTSAKVVVIDNGSTVYPVAFNYGIVIATGDVSLDRNFTGMVMSGGTISMAAGSFSSDELLVSGLFEEDASLGIEATFTNIFPSYKNYAADVLGVMKPEDYIGYDNWTKYVE